MSGSWARRRRAVSDVQRERKIKELDGRHSDGLTCSEERKRGKEAVGSTQREGGGSVRPKLRMNTTQMLK